MPGIAGTRRPAAAAAGAFIVAAFVALAATPEAARSAGRVPDACGLTTSERVVAVGDVHGAFDRFTGILRAAGLVDERRRWTGGQAVLVQLGDVVDRGPKSRDVIDLLRRLDSEAARAGGQVHALVGNHEVMRLQRQLRDASAEEYAAFRSPDAGSLRDGLYQVMAGRRRAQEEASGGRFDAGAYRRQFYETTPLGIVELLRAFAPEGDYGRWLRRRGTIVRINGVVYTHGGVSRVVAPLGCGGIDEATRRELIRDAEADEDEAPLITREDGPLWYRGFVNGDATPADVAAVFAALDARAMVVGHTTMADRRIASLFDGRIFAIDTGMLGDPMYPGGVASALEIHGDVVTAIYADGRVPLGTLNRRP